MQEPTKLVYTVAEVCALLGFTRNTVTRLFESEPGTIILDSPERMHKRGYRTVRIPKHVYERVLGKLSVQ